MQKLRILTLAVLLPFALYGAKKQDLPYNYIDNSAPKITKELAEQRYKKGLGERLENAESSGFMLGIGGGMIYPINLNNYSVRDIGGVCRYNGRNYLVNEPYKIEGIKASSNLLLGYKWFSNSINSYWFGIRYYVDYNARFLDIVMSHSVGLNVDFLFNIVNKKPFNFWFIFWWWNWRSYRTSKSKILLFR